MMANETCNTMRRRVMASLPGGGKADDALAYDGSTLIAETLPLGKRGELARSLSRIACENQENTGDHARTRKFDAVYAVRLTRLR
jgi:hypothetical protein